MPDVKVRFPIALMNYEKTRIRFADDAASIIARELECNDYDGKPVGLEPDHIDVHLQAYKHKSCDVRFKGAKMLIEITGYDYPERMSNIKQRLTSIKERLALLNGISDFDYIAITYIPIPDGCWA